MDNAPAPLTQLLNQAAHGDAAARAQALERLYADLHAAARRLMLGERSGHTLSATALVHEVYLRVFSDESAGWADRTQFLRYARTAMAHLLIDHARQRNSQRRGGGLLQAIDDRDWAGVDDGDAFAVLDEALQTLARVNPRAAQVLKLRCLAGLDVEQTAAVTGVSERTVVRDWDLARALLSQMLAPLASDAMAGDDARHA